MVFLWCCVCVLAFGGCCLCLPLLFCACFLCSLGLLRIGSFPPGSVPPLVLPASRLVPWGFLVQSVFCWSLSPGIWLYLATARLPCLVVWSVVTARLLSSLFLMATKASALCGALPSTMLRVLFRCFFPALRYSPSGDPEPPLETVRAACAHLLGPCCFLPSCPLLPSLAPSPSCCCWPPLAFSLLVPVHTKAIMARNSVFKWSVFAFLASCCCLFGVFWSLFLFCWCVLLLYLLSAN